MPARQVILANGCFDVLHVGHIRYLHAAKQLGGRLVVAVNSDASVRAVKGPERPLMPEDERAEIIAALADVDAVVIFLRSGRACFDPRTASRRAGQRHRLQRRAVPERDEVIAVGGRVEIVGDPKDHSSSALLSKIVAAVSTSVPARQPERRSIGDPTGEFGNVDEKR